MDVLADVLRSLRLRGTVYFRAEFREPWGLEMQNTGCANFHIVVKGRCWLRLNAVDPPRILEPGDVAVFPRGDPHALLHAPSASAVPAAELIGGDAKSGQETERAFGGDGPVTTTLICGHFDYDRRYPHPLLETLPPAIHVSAADHGSADWIETAGKLAAAESDSVRPGAGAIVDRLAEALLIQALLGYVDRLPQSDSNRFIAAIQDRCIGRALSLIHEDLARDWTLVELAKEAGVSRTVFAERFRELVGESPMVYLARCRMLKAHQLLLDTSMSVAQIAEEIGYQSEFSFSKAFKRIFGMPPGEARREA